MHRRILVIVVSALAAVVAVRLSALYAIPQTREVPVARLVANLERDLKADPRNIELQINLARLHGMAYALKTEVVAAAPRAGDREEPFYGLHPDLIPYKPERAATPAAEAAAREHLKKSISHYEAALALDSRNLLARLGYGWVLDQAGEKTRAIGEYRQVIKEAWVTEETAYRALPETRFFTAEAADYLIRLLDPARDASEISDLQVKKKALDDRPARAITPIAIPLADDISPRAIVAPDARVRLRRRRLRLATPMDLDPPDHRLARPRSGAKGPDHFRAAVVRQRDVLAVLDERIRGAPRLGRRR